MPFEVYLTPRARAFRLEASRAVFADIERLMVQIENGPAGVPINVDGLQEYSQQHGSVRAFYHIADGATPRPRLTSGPRTDERGPPSQAPPARPWTRGAVRGTWFDDYLNPDGSKGANQDQTNVFRREGKPCLHCGTTVQKKTFRGRGTHYCPPIASVDRLPGCITSSGRCTAPSYGNPTQPPLRHQEILFSISREPSRS